MLCAQLFPGMTRGVMLSIIFLLQHPEFSFLLKERVCALVIKLFSPNIKYRTSIPASVQQATPLDKPYFPISMRLLRVVSILIQQYHSLLVRHSWSLVRHCAENMTLTELTWELKFWPKFEKFVSHCKGTYYIISVLISLFHFSCQSLEEVLGNQEFCKRYCNIKYLWHDFRSFNLKTCCCI